MEKLERYLDQVCRGIAGPRGLRQHIRQELREHLQEAVADLQAAGRSIDEAWEQAIANFGGPDEIGSELVAAHGQRWLTVVIDKTLQWKEATMRSKLLWTALAHGLLAGLIGVQLWFLIGSDMFFAPKTMRIMQDVGVRPDDPFLAWSESFLAGLTRTMNQYAPVLIGLPIVVWALFEWRVRSENKPWIRLTGLGVVAIALMVTIVLMTVAMLVPLYLTVPELMRGR